MTSTELKALIDLEITNKTTTNSITPANVGETEKKIVDYVNQEIQTVETTPGPQGPAGPQGPIGPAGLEWKGTWTSGTSYDVNDAVGFAGASWFCTVATSGTTSPNLDTTHWALLASVGAIGPQGNAGTAGYNGGLIFKWAESGSELPSLATGEFIYEIPQSSNGFVGQLHISAKTLLEQDIENVISTWDDSTNTIKGTITLQGNAPTSYRLLCLEVLSGMTFVSTPNPTFKIPVNHISPLATYGYPGTYSLTFCRAGDKGDEGILPAKTKGTVAGQASLTPAELIYSMNMISGTGSSRSFKLPNVTLPGVEVIVNNAGSLDCYVRGALTGGAYIETGATSSASAMTVSPNEVYKFTSSGNNYWLMEYLQRSPTKVNDKVIDNDIPFFTVVVNSSFSTVPTLVNLNSNYPDATYFIGFLLVLPNHNISFVKTGTSSWMSFPLTPVV